MKRPEPPATAASGTAGASPWLRRAPWLACLVVLVVGSFYAAQLDREQRFNDERDYLRIAHFLYHRGTFSVDGVDPTAYRAPGYPAVLGLVAYYGRSGVAIRIANYLALCGTLLLGVAFLRRRGMPRAAAMAAVLTAVYPPFFYTASTIYPQTLGGLLLAALFCLLPHGRPLGVGRGALLGLLAAALVLTIPTFLAGLGAAGLWILWRSRGASLPGLLAMGAVVVLAVGAWGLRNRAALGSFVPLTTNSGRNLLLGNSPQTTPTSGVNVDLSLHEEYVEAQGFDEVERDRYFRSVALAWIREEPLAAAKLYALKLLNHFNVYNTYATDDELGKAESIVLAAFFVPLFAVFLWRLARLRRDPPFQDEATLLVVYGVMALASAVFFTRIRFRLPLDHTMLWIVAAYLTGEARRHDPARAQKEPR